MLLDIQGFKQQQPSVTGNIAVLNKVIQLALQLTPISLAWYFRGILMDVAIHSVTKEKLQYIAVSWIISWLTGLTFSVSLYQAINDSQPP